MAGRIGRLAQQGGVVPRLAGSHAAFAVGPLGNDVGEEGAHVARHPAGAERHVANVHAQVAQAAVLAVEFHHAASS